jgi:hypothetical protein
MMVKTTNRITIRTAVAAAAIVPSIVLGSASARPIPGVGARAAPARVICR